jgi:hypothetical protein
VAGSTEPEPAADEGAIVLEWVRGRDVECPLCGYNLRDLSEPRCPECRKALTLAVSLREMRIGWFLVTVTPGLFSVIAATLLLIPIIVVPLTEGGAPPWFILALDAFGWLSGIAALVLIRRRVAFLRLPTARQQVWGLLAWAVHIGVFFLFLALAISY